MGHGFHSYVSLPEGNDGIPNDGLFVRPPGLCTPGNINGCFLRRATCLTNTKNALENVVKPSNYEPSPNGRFIIGFATLSRC